jgi:hypothetical protein
MVSSKKLDFSSVVGIFGAMAIVMASLFWHPMMPTEARVNNPTPSHMSFFSFGQQMVIADALWVRSIQDFDYCEKEVASRICVGKSWLYQILNELTNLAPDYLTAYREGGMALSVIISDIPGASAILDKGVIIFPKDFDLLYRAGYHALFEEKDKLKAGKIFLQAAQTRGVNGDWFYNVSARLYNEGGKREVSLQIYKDMKAAGLDPSYLDRMREKLDIKKEEVGE